MAKRVDKTSTSFVDRRKFLKGAAAVHSLRGSLGDSTFFRGFRSVFTNGTDAGQTSLETFRKSFEAAAGKSLEDFFRTWYATPGLPD